MIPIFAIFTNLDCACFIKCSKLLANVGKNFTKMCLPSFQFAIDFNHCLII